MPGSALPSVFSPPCREASLPTVLPPEARESSGVVPADSPDGLRSVWTHNDSGWPAELLRISDEGHLLDRVQLQGASNVDWEDLAAAPCPPGVGQRGPGEAARGRCLVVADTGDNLERRGELALYWVPEPPPGATLSEPALRVPLRLPHGPRDMEALIPLDHGRMLLVTKGRNHPIEVYQVEPDGRVKRTQHLTRRTPGIRGFVTGGAGATTGDGGRVAALRGYASLHFYRVVDQGGDARLEAIPGGQVNLLPLREAQGEAVAFGGGGRVLLTSEGGLVGGPASLRVLDCSEGFARWGITPGGEA